MLVTIIQQIVPHYRVAFFRQLHARLQREGIALRLLYGDKSRGPADTGQIMTDTWAVRVDTVKAQVGVINLVWQSALQSLGKSDLVIVEQSNRLLINYLLQINRWWSPRKLAYWGHGRNMQSDHPYGLRELLKGALLHKVDWWFAYTDMTRDYLVSKNFPSNRITVVNNAVEDNLSAYLNECALLSPVKVHDELGLSSSNVALFCGGLYKEKRLEFMLCAAERIRSKIPGFELVIIGDGPDRHIVERAARANDWIHYVGPMFGTASAKYWYASKVLLMPGLVGLVVVDSFIAGCPLITTSYPHHSPEIAYLESGSNGIKTANDVEAFADRTIDLLNSENELDVLRQGCLLSASKYTLANMVENFACGVMQSLAH